MDNLDKMIISSKERGLIVSKILLSFHVIQEILLTYQPSNTGGNPASFPVGLVSYRGFPTEARPDFDPGHFELVYA